MIHEVTANWHILIVGIAAQYIRSSIVRANEHWTRGAANGHTIASVSRIKLQSLQ